MSVAGPGVTAPVAGLGQVSVTRMPGWSLGADEAIGRARLWRTRAWGWHGPAPGRAI
jgi:hypothetical protein